MAVTVRATVAVLLATFVLAATTTPADARAPGVDEARARSWILKRIVEDREADRNKPKDPWELLSTAYVNPETALGDWEPLTTFIRNKDNRLADRMNCVNALKTRIAAETVAGTDAKTLLTVKKAIARELLELFVRDDPGASSNVSHMIIGSLLSAFFPNPNPAIEHSPSDRQKRQKAYRDWQKYLRD